MGLFIILIITEILTLIVIRQHFYDKSWISYYFVITFNTVLSIWLWILWFKASSYRGIFDESGYIWGLTSLSGMMAAVVFPRILIIIFHFSGWLARKKTGGHIRILTNSGLIISLLIFLVIAEGTIKGRFNFKTENITVKIKGLKPDLAGLKIVQISDLHLTSFYHHQEVLEKVMTKINDLNPDLLINTGDFITIGWREFSRFDTILRKSNAKYGNFAVMGNHDFGTYHPYFTDAERDNNVLLMNKFISSSGYRVLNDEFRIVNIGESKIALIGVMTKGSFPKMIHGDLNKAARGIYGADLKILLAHDPNQWDTDVTGKTDIDITLSGHTHGMQAGILTRTFKWSPAQYFYPRWNGLYKEGEQYLAVNRGLGVLGIPFRIWMPPEITLITLQSE
jgi:predicted MPP superfamily phosphohydrolase